MIHASGIDEISDRHAINVHREAEIIKDQLIAEVSDLIDRANKDAASSVTLLNEARGKHTLSINLMSAIIGDKVETLARLVDDYYTYYK